MGIQAFRVMVGAGFYGEPGFQGDGWEWLLRGTRLSG